MRRYDTIVPDHPPGQEIEVKLLINGEPVIELRVTDNVVASPAPYVGQHLRKGFVGWAMSNLEGEQLDAALVLHKGYFVGQSHFFLQNEGKVGSLLRNYEGACYTYTEPQLSETEQLRSRRYFPEGEGLLEFRTA